MLRSLGEIAKECLSFLALLAGVLVLFLVAIGIVFGPAIAYRGWRDGSNFLLTVGLLYFILSIFIVGLVSWFFRDND